MHSLKIWSADYTTKQCAAAHEENGRTGFLVFGKELVADPFLGFREKYFVQAVGYGLPITPLNGTRYLVG